MMENSPHRFTRGAPRIVADDQSDRDNAKRTEAALVIWQSAMPAWGTPADTSLVRRGRIPPPPTKVRFHARLKHPSGGIWPAMVSLVTHGGDGNPAGIHRTFLTRDGSGKAPLDPAKMMLGPCRGGAVRLDQPKHVLMVGEGIETCLAAMQASGNAAWAALSTSGLRAHDLPGELGEVIVLAEGRDRGDVAAHASAHLAQCNGLPQRWGARRVVSAWPR